MQKIDVSSSEIPPHPGEVRHDLECAADKLRRLRDAATARGDEVGARAWDEAARAAVRVIGEVAAAHSAQTWNMKRTEQCPMCKR